jgi:hypothetical protein
MSNVRSETVRFRNPTQHTLKLYCVGLEDVPPGGEIDIPMEICAPGRTDAGARKKSILEDVCPQLVPVADHDKEALGTVPPAPAPVSKIVSIAGRLQPPQEAPGVKALRDKREALIKAAQEKQAAQAAAQDPSKDPVKEPATK